MKKRLAFSYQRLVLSFVIVSLFLLLATHSVYAQNQDYTATNLDPEVPKNLHTWTQTVLIEVVSATSCQLSGLDPTDANAKCLGVDQKTGKIGFVENGGGAVGALSYMIGYLYEHPPATSGQYTRYLAENFGITKGAYAAALPNECSRGVGATGSGYCGIKPLLGIWGVSRNLVYFLMIVVFIVIGFAVMLRVKIDPRTVMTIEGTLPRLVLGIILVGLSFPIAGFLIDFMYIFIYFFYNVVLTIPIDGLKGSVEGLNPLFLQGQNPTTALGGFFGIGDIAKDIAAPITIGIKDIIGIGPVPYDSVIDIINPLGMFETITKLFLEGEQNYYTGGTPLDFFIDFVSLLAGISGGVWFGQQFLDSSVAGFTQKGLFSLAGITTVGPTIMNTVQFVLREFLPHLLVYVVILIAILYSLIRLWFQLILAYINILLDIVLAPWWILGTLIPGSKISFSLWFRDMLGNLAVFPTALIMLTFANIFSKAFSVSETVPFNPPLLGLPGQDGNVLGSLVAMGFILMTPEALKIAKGLFQAPPLNLASIMPPLAAGASVPAYMVRKPWEIIKKASQYEFTGQKVGLTRAIFPFAPPKPFTGRPGEETPPETKGRT
ncbi:MAG: hypothetical protein HY426_01820 [Candidatus Levybacteria bacterium]|nr:hypothetical protein [Candidatus Levybacteria bacterium]